MPRGRLDCGLVSLMGWWSLSPGKNQDSEESKSPKKGDFVFSRNDKNGLIRIY